MKNFYDTGAAILGKLYKQQGTIKALVMAEKVVDKKLLYAVLSKPLLTILIYDLLFGKGIKSGGAYKPLVLKHRARLNAELVKIKIKRRCKDNKDLIPDHIRNAIVIPRYVRVNTIKVTVENTIQHFTKNGYNLISFESIAKSMCKDKHLPELLVLPPSADLHEDDYLLKGNIILQVEYMLLDPSCSGSGIVGRMDHLVQDIVPEESNAESAEDRVKSLAEFQKEILLHAFKFPKVKRIVYSTCSKHNEENELVVKHVLEENKAFRLVQGSFPTWDRRGVPIIKGAERSVIRPLQDREPLRSAPWNIEPESVYGLEKFGIPVQLSVTHTAISPIITLAFDSGNLVLGLVMQTVLPVWVTDKSQFEIIYSLTVHEVITVSSGFSSNIDLYCDRHLVDTIFYRSTNGIYQIQLDIGRYLDESQLIDVEKPLASVRQLIDTGNDVITGFQIISDLTLGPSYICLVSTGQLIADLIFKVHNQQKAVQTVDPKNVKTLSDFDYSALDCVAKMSTLSTKSKPYPEFIDKESFKKVGENIVETRKKIQIIVSGFAKLKQRVEELENAQTSQAETTVKVEEQILRLKTKSTEVTKRFKELKSRNEIQYQRITTILEILYDLTQPKLSSQEIKWFQEMTMMNNEFENHHKPTLKKRIAGIDTTEEKDNQFEIVLGTQQVRDVQRNLKEESEELKSLTKRIATMNLMVDNLLAQNENK
ncbi:putative 28S rRNA (cytosine-C(5))-methyltransferase [Globomyces sp. JEL0801]|nr:putative 28S rRNA (cytosine-C(5))-methyltransferase [Globomyces sp. JEL0801]